MSKTKSWLILGTLCVLAITGFATLLMKDPEWWRPSFLDGLQRYPCEMSSIERENPFRAYEGNGKFEKVDVGRVRCDDFLVPDSFERAVQKTRMGLPGWDESTTEEGDFQMEKGRFAIRVYLKSTGRQQRIRVWNLFKMHIGKYVR